MTTSYSQVNPGDIVLSPMRITAYPPGGGAGVDLGGTEGGVILSLKTDLAPILVDQYGKTEINHKVSGQHYSVKTILAQSADKTKWKQAFPHFDLITDISGHTLFVINAKIGDDLLSHAGKLVLHPLANADADLSQDYTIDLAACKSASELKYGPEKQIGLGVEFHVYLNTTVSPARFLTYGDRSIGIVHASAGAAVAGVNTGNGTIGTIAAYDGHTKTETITLLCVAVDPTHGNVFSVTGSLSGLLGNFTLAAANLSTATFTQADISFVATQGSTQFAYGDSFTIATVAANFA
jgi:hypothetical protein